jgi:hypothetical protein
MNISDRPAWHAQANCGRNGIIGNDPARRIRIMYPGSYGPNSHEPGAPFAIDVCHECPVKGPCAAARDDFGTWAGVGQRQHLKATAAARQAKLPPHGTVARYGYHRCRCDYCKAAAAQRALTYRAAGKLRRKAITPPETRTA